MAANLPTGRFISDLISQEMDIGEAISALKTSVVTFISSKRMAYISLSSDYTVHDLYLTQKCFDG